MELKSTTPLRTQRYLQNFPTTLVAERWESDPAIRVGDTVTPPVTPRPRGPRNSTPGSDGPCRWG